MTARNQPQVSEKVVIARSGRAFLYRTQNAYLIA